MTDKAKKYLSDILLAVKLIEDFTNGIASFEEYQNDLKTKSAVERQLAIIGEAVNQFRKYEEEFALNHTRQIVDFRNRIIHAYYNLDDSIIWAILQVHIPILKQEAEEGLK
jgi:uncharacterized protein with HEPN domain